MRMQTPDIERVKKFEYTEGSVTSALRELGVDIHEGPKEVVMRCCFHNDSEGGKPNLYINIGEKPGVYHCFKCDARGSFDNFVRTYTGWNEFRVIKFLMRHRSAVTERVGKKTSVVRKVTEEKLAEYSYRHEYCYERGLTEPTLRRYKVGFDREDNSIIFPWFDRVGKLSAIKRRSVLDKYYIVDTDESPWHLLYGLHLVKPNSIVWICEGEFDAMYLDQCFREYNFAQHAAIALGGKVLQHKAYLELCKKSPVAIVLALDSDDAGREAAKQIKSILDSTFYTQVLEYDEAKDPNALPSTVVAKYIQHININYAQHVSQQSERYAQWKGQNART